MLILVEIYDFGCSVPADHERGLEYFERGALQVSLTA